MQLLAKHDVYVGEINDCFDPKHYKNGRLDLEEVTQIKEL